MSLAVGQILAERRIAAEVAAVLLEIEDAMEFHEGKPARWPDASKPETWRMSPAALEKLVELRLRMERLEIG